MTVAYPPPPRTRRFTPDEYHQMADLGFFQNQRVELLDGEIVEMAAQHEPHVWAVSQLIAIFSPRLAEPFMLRCQAPLSIGNSEPEPDIAVVSLPTPKDGAPATAALVIKVADSSLPIDRQKAHMYASAQIPEYWIVNLIDRRLERFTEPMHDPACPYSAKYRAPTMHAPSTAITPLALPLGPIQLSPIFNR